VGDHLQTTVHPVADIFSRHQDSCQDPSHTPRLNAAPFASGSHRFQCGRRPNRSSAGFQTFSVRELPSACDFGRSASRFASRYRSNARAGSAQLSAPFKQPCPLPSPRDWLSGKQKEQAGAGSGLFCDDGIMNPLDQVILRDLSHHSCSSVRDMPWVSDDKYESIKFGPDAKRDILFLLYHLIHRPFPLHYTVF
jgi:hypothetical protein